MNSGEPVALFFFAHQDDEFGVFQQIADERRRGRRVYCAYLTDGAFGGVSSIRRNRESLFVLKQFGIPEQDVFFAGYALSIPDARLARRLEPASDWIAERLSHFSPVESIYVPAWEGGHHDHDALHALVVSIAEQKGMLESIRQFPLYNGYRCVGPLFRVQSPLPFNGPVESKRIAWRSRVRYLRHCLSYRSQTKSWMGLFPFLLLHYLRCGEQILQPVSVERTRQRPHEGPLYYERRGFFTWEEMNARLADWRGKNMIRS